MKNLIIALSLTLVSSASFANGFSPWEERGVTATTSQEASFEAATNNAGFAPWRDRDHQSVFANEKGVAMEIVEKNIFRPWS